MISLGDVKIEIPVFLAPMSGSTDAPFRRQASRFGAPVVVTEMIAGEELARGRKDMVRRLAMHDESQLFVVQLAGRDENWMRESARLVRGAGADVIDINMGCPSRHVTGGQSGSALMRDLNLARRLIRATVEGAEGPVTVKMRLGWDEENQNAPELAQIAQEEGCVMVTVHGRTRCQFYNGEADWEAVRKVCESTFLPVIVNGDISSTHSAREALAVSGAAGVMIGRAAMGRSWLIGQIATELSGKRFEQPSAETQIHSLIQQLTDSVDLYGEFVGVKTFRKHLAAYIDRLEWGSNASTDRRVLRREMCRIDSAHSLHERLLDLLNLQVSSREAEQFAC